MSVEFKKENNEKLAALVKKDNGLDMNAQFERGESHEREQQYAEAFKWYQRASQQGHKDALLGIKRLSSVGFEFEMNGHVVRWKNGTATDEVLPPKVVVKKNNSVWLESECDDHSEIITAPIYSFEDLESVLTDFETLIKDTCENRSSVRGAGKRMATQYDPTEYARITTEEEGLQREHLKQYADIDVAVRKKQTNGILQATIGIPLEQLILLFNLEEAWEPLKPWLKSDIIKNRSLAIGSPELNGFILLIEHYISWLQEKKGSRNSHGPKALLGLMCRNNFAEIYNALEPEDKEKFRVYARGKDKPETLIFPNGYNACGKIVTGSKSMNVGEWLLSIYDPAKGLENYLSRVRPHLEAAELKEESERPTTYDLLSPPPFFFHHQTEEVSFTYGMGREPMLSSKSILLELRDPTGRPTAISYMTAIADMRNFSKFFLGKFSLLPENLIVDVASLQLGATSPPEEKKKIEVTHRAKITPQPSIGSPASPATQSPVASPLPQLASPFARTFPVLPPMTASPHTITMFGGKLQEPQAHRSKTANVGTNPSSFFSSPSLPTPFVMGMSALSEDKGKKRQRQPVEEKVALEEGIPQPAAAKKPARIARRLFIGDEERLAQTDQELPIDVSAPGIV